MRSYCVTVNGGSGVLVNAMTQEYSYVLTAAHVIPESLDDLLVHDYQGNRLGVLSVLIPSERIQSKSDSNDYAIIKVDHQGQVSQGCINASELPHLASLTLVGFPETERKSEDPIKDYTGHKISVANKLIMMHLHGIPGIETIRGMSGGGVYHVKNEKPFLVGVEFRMDGATREQQFGRAQCHSLSKFEELIDTNFSAPMIPAYLECFSNMRDKIFTFNVIDQSNVVDLKRELINAADFLIQNGLRRPFEFMKQYNSDLLIDSTSNDELKSYELWVAYLEFLVISVLMDGSQIADDSYLENLEKKRRLVYTSDGTNWISRLEELLKIARRLLEKDGVLIVSSPESAAKVLPPEFRLEKIINNISVVPNEGPFPVIDSAENELLTSFRLTHLEGLRNRCVVDVEDDYVNLQVSNQRFELLRDKLSEIIS